MPDREKVIETLESCVANPLHRKGDKFVISFDVRFVNAIIELLKEQEAVEPILKREAYNKYYNYYVCPRCDNDVVYEQSYCSECGVKFLWEGR